MPPGFDRVELVGEKVRLRPTTGEDATDAYRLVRDEAVLRWLLWDGPADEAELSGTFRRWQTELKTGESYNFSIERVEEPGLIGCIGPRLVTHPQQADVGYWLGGPYWNNGYMTEAIRLVCHFSFEYLGVVRVYASVLVGNIGSRRALEKNGFSVDGTLRSHVIKRGEWRDEWFLTLLRSEWERDRAGFRPQGEDIVIAGSDA